MKNPQKVISILLFAVGIFALCIGCKEVVRRINDTSNVFVSESSSDHTAQAGETLLESASDTPAEVSTESTSEVLLENSTEASTETASEVPTEASSETAPEVPTKVSSETASEMPTEASSEAASETPTDISTENTSEVPTENSAESSSEAETPYISPYNDYFTKYPDMAAWFQIPGTNVDYPVMWTPGDETYYLYRHYDGSDNINGSLLLDTDSSLSPLTTNLIIHGHNMKSGAMFGNLPMYEDKKYYEQHKEMLLYTPDGERKYEVIAVFRSQVFKKSDTCFKYYKFFQADTEEEFNDFYDNIKALSVYDTGVTAEFGDRFITLSTCVSHVENGRFVVVAKEITQE